MNGRDILLDLRATMDSFYPWKAFVGLVTLRPSEFAAKDGIYAVDTHGMKIGGLDILADFGQSVVLHPDVISITRQAMFEGERLTREPTDDELAAWLFWAIRSRASVGGET